MPRSIRPVASLMVVMLTMAAPVLAHPGHEHDPGRPLVEQVAHPAFGWEHYAIAASIAAAAISYAAWRRRAKAGR